MPKLVKFFKAALLFILISLFSLPALAKEGDILLFDDFNDGNYNGWSVESGSWSVNNGNLFTNQTGVFSFLGEIHTGSDWDNYRIELDVNNERGVDEGIEFRKNGNTHYTFNLRHGTGSFNTPEIKFFKAVNGVDSLLASTHSQQLLNNTWYHLKIEVLNENIKLWVNDTLRFDYTDPGTDIKKGGLGLQSWTGANGFIRLRFDNVKVTALAPPKTPLILIPGIGGSELKVNQDTIWNKDDGHGGVYNHSYSTGEKVWVNENEAAQPGYDDYFDVLRMKTDGTTSEANLGLTGNLYSGAYQGAIDFFTSNGYKLNQDLFVFPYDWRKDINHTASLLDQKIQSIKQQTGSQKVDIVAHSMGGLVARNYIADANRAQNVRKLFTLGTPHLGAVESLKNIAYGGCLTKLTLLAKLICLGIPPAEIKDVLRNLVSGFELIPSQTYFNFYSGEDNRHPYPYRTESGALNYIQIKNLLASLNHNTALFTPSEAFHSIDNTLSNVSGVDITVVAGSGQNTLGQIIEEKTISLLGIQSVHKDAININGDNTVPLYSASLNDPGKNYSLLGSAKVYYTKQKHEELVTNGPALNLVKNILDNNNQLPSGVSSQPYNFSGTSLSVHSPVNIHVYDANGNHTGPTANGDFQANIPGSSYDTLGDAKFIYLPENGVYNVKFEATDDGSFDFKIRKFENDLNTETVLYKNIPLTNTTKAETAFDTSSTQPPVLQIDQDGNGTIDTRTNAFSTLSGDANYDQTPPKTTVSLAGIIGNNGWYKSDVVVTLTTEDQNGSGVQKIEYMLNNNQTVQTYSQPFTVSEEGIIKLKFRSIDKAGNEETPREIEFKIDKTPPLISIDASPKTLWPPNNKMTDVKIMGSSTDLNPYITKITVEDEYHQVEPAVSDFNQTIKLQSSRNGDDKDGRKYTIKAVAEDLAGNISQAVVEVIVPHDQSKK